MAANLPLTEQLRERLKDEPIVLIDVYTDWADDKNPSPTLRECKQLEWAKYIVLIYQGVPFVSVYTKQQDNRHWLNEDYDTLDMNIRLGDLSLSVRDVYHKINLTGATTA